MKTIITPLGLQGIMKSIAREGAGRGKAERNHQTSGVSEAGGRCVSDTMDALTFPFPCSWIF